MTNLFLKVNKDLFNLGLNPTEVLVLAQVIEFNTNTGDCYMTDKQFAEMLNVSDKTISRALKTLEEKGFVKRATTNIKGGKERHITANMGNIEEFLTKDKMSLVQQTNCPLYNGQNDLIKDNSEKDNEKENNSGLFQPAVEKSLTPEAEVKVDGSLRKTDLLCIPQENYTYINPEKTLIKTKLNKVFEIV